MAKRAADGFTLVEVLVVVVVIGIASGIVIANLGGDERRSAEREAFLARVRDMPAPAATGARGRLVLEAKGGEIRCLNGNWERKKSGRWTYFHPPFFQARDNSFEIYDYLKRYFGKEAPEAGMPFNHVVVFTGIDFNVETIEMPRP